MDLTSSHQEKKTSENVQHFSGAKEYEKFTHEQTNTQRDVTEKIIAYQNYIREDKYPSHAFQNPELYQTSHPRVQSSIGNSSLFGKNHILIQKHDNVSKLKHQQDKSLAQTFCLPGDNSAYSKSANSDRVDGERNRIIGIGPQNYDRNYKTRSKRIVYQNRVYEIANGSSYICEPVDSKRVTGRLNDNVLLCCKPRTHKSIYIKPNDEGSGIGKGSIDGHIHPKIGTEPKGDKSYEERNYRYIENPYHEPQKMNVDESDFRKHDSPGVGNSTFLQELTLFDYQNPREKSEMDRKTRCTKLSKKFIRFLWALFLLSVVLVIIGLLLLIHCVVHFISRNYINTVMEHTGFITWIWIVMIISVFIIIIGVYGVLASVDRSRRILVVFCIIAFILAFLILVFLVFLWVLFLNMEDVELRSMKNTLKTYRCDRYIRNAWDDLQITHECCGVEDHLDWKYVPPSCCNATNKQEKIACVRHYITGKQAFSDGCKTKLEEYFFAFFVIAACLLFLGFVLLILGILAALWLLRRYKRVEKCQEVYYISR